MFEGLSYLREKRIPTLDSLRKKKRGYRQWPIDTTHELHSEQAVELTDLGLAGKNLYHHADTAPYYRTFPGSIPSLYLRQSVARKLESANRRLKDGGLELYVFDGYRPIELQNYFHDVWYPERLKRRQPELTDEELWKSVERYWAKGSPTGLVDPQSPPPHCTGAAVDLTLRTVDSQDHLFMGSVVDELSEVAQPDYFENNMPDKEPSLSGDEARGNRRLLHWIMTEEGFSANPNEWWHFSWGDQMWAKLHGHRAAYYSVLEI